MKFSIFEKLAKRRLFLTREYERTHDDSLRNEYQEIDVILNQNGSISSKCKMSIYDFKEYLLDFLIGNGIVYDIRISCDKERDYPTQINITIDENLYIFKSDKRDMISMEPLFSIMKNSFSRLAEKYPALNEYYWEMFKKYLSKKRSLKIEIINEKISKKEAEIKTLNNPQKRKNLITALTKEVKEAEEIYKAGYCGIITKDPELIALQDKCADICVEKMNKLEEYTDPNKRKEKNNKVKNEVMDLQKQIEIINEEDIEVLQNEI